MLKMVKIDISDIEHFRNHKKNALNYFLYYLQDPFTFEICYVGETYDPVKRYRDHCNPGVGIWNGRLAIWADYLASKHEKPLMTFFWHLMGFPAHGKIREIEAKVIHRYWRLGHPLMNQTLKKEVGWSQRINKSRYWTLVKQTLPASALDL